MCMARNFPLRMNFGKITPEEILNLTSIGNRLLEVIKQ